MYRDAVIEDAEPELSPGRSTPKPGGRRLAAVLFDMDGTLFDSEKLWTIGLDDLAAHLGGELSAAARRAMVGNNMLESMRILHQDLGLECRDLEDSAMWLEQRMFELFAAGPIWRPGARELLAAVHLAGIQTALVTATRRKLVEVALVTLGPGRFDAIVAGDDVPRTKPHPDPYRRAADLLAVDPSDCVAVEDSPNGVLSASAAGCAVLGVPCELPLVEAPGVHLRSSLVGLSVEDLAGLLG